ncbi:DUF1559 family PulG-like putative transporter [Thermopirellula anaerolimosa]
METSRLCFSFTSSNVERSPLACATSGARTNILPLCRKVFLLAVVAQSCFLSALLLCAVGIAGCRVGGFGCDARSAARRVQCDSNLRTLYDALLKYVSLHGDVPRGKDGKASIDPLNDPKVQEELGIGPSTLRCPADKNPSGPFYVLNPALIASDLRDDSTTIVACDRTPNHVGFMGNPLRLVLLGDGSRVCMYVPLKDQEEWLRLFLSGDKRACTVLRKEGNMGSTGLMWYVGKDKGYVGNE